MKNINIWFYLILVIAFAGGAWVIYSKLKIEKAPAKKPIIEWGSLTGGEIVE